MKGKDKYAIKQIRKMHNDPQPKDHDPTIPYKRTVVRTKQCWPYEMIRQGKTRVLFQYVGIWALVLVMVGVGLYFLITWIWGLLGW